MSLTGGSALIAVGRPNFDEKTLNGKNPYIANTVARLKDFHGFDFVAVGLTAFQGAPLKWVYSAGATSSRYKRIVLAPGHGIGGIVLKAGKPMVCTNIEEQIDPREYSSYPIVFAEDIQSFIAVPLSKSGRVVAVLLCACRHPEPRMSEILDDMVKRTAGGICEMSYAYTGYSDIMTMAKSTHVTDKLQFFGASQSKRVINAQEEERRHIARELHDGIGQELLALSFTLASLEQADSMEDVSEGVQAARGIIEVISEQIHNISVDLRPSTLDHFGLLSALRSTFNVYQARYGAKINLEAPEDLTRPSPAYETQIYRIIQEAVLNACKYSGSDEINVVIDQAGGWLSAAICDDGEGFDTEHPFVKGSGCGLDNMKERAAIAGGTLQIRSDEEGTVINLVVPLISKQAEEKWSI